MKPILSIILSLLCTGCLATQGALTKLNYAIGEASAAALEAKATAENVNATQADVDAAMTVLATNAALTTEALVAVQDAVVADIESAKGFSGLGGGADGGMIGLALTGLAWWLRDRRYKKRPEGGPGYAGPGDTVPPDLTT